MSDDRKLESRVLGGMAIDPALGNGALVSLYAGPAFANWRAISPVNAADALEASIAAVQGGDLSGLEALLTAQAFALSAMFTDLANRARGQASRDAVNSLTTLALKAQSQARTTCLAIAEIKNPRQTAFVRQQTNITSGGGAQQVNVGDAIPARARARKKASAVPNKQLASEDGLNGCTKMDIGATRKTVTSHRKLATVGAGNRAKKPGG